MGMTNKQLTEIYDLTFTQAYYAMLNGKKVKRRGWKGYWAFENGTIMMHIFNEGPIDIRETNNVAYTFSNICENDWMVIDDSIDLRNKDVWTIKM